MTTPRVSPEERIKAIAARIPPGESWSTRKLVEWLIPEVIRAVRSAEDDALERACDAVDTFGLDSYASDCIKKRIRLLKSGGSR